MKEEELVECLESLLGNVKMYYRFRRLLTTIASCNYADDEDLLGAAEREFRYLEQAAK